MPAGGKCGIQLKTKAGIELFKFWLDPETVPKAPLWHSLVVFGAIRVTQPNPGLSDQQPEMSARLTNWLATVRVG